MKEALRARRRLSRLIDALPVLSGFATVDGHLLQTRPEASETFLWSLPAFAYSKSSMSEIVALCARVEAGERIQIERPYAVPPSGDDDPLSASRVAPPHPLLEEDQSRVTLRRGLLTLVPIRAHTGDVDEMAITLLDAETAGIPEPPPNFRSRLSIANARIDMMLSLGRQVVELSQSGDCGESARRVLTGRLDTLGQMIDAVSDPDRTDYPLASLIGSWVQAMPRIRAEKHLRLTITDASVPISAVPVLSLLLNELTDNAARHGAWQSADASETLRGSVSLETEWLDDGTGRTLCLHWSEDAPMTEARKGTLQTTGFGYALATQILPEITGGTAHPLPDADGMGWTITLPISRPNATRPDTVDLPPAPSTPPDGDDGRAQPSPSAPRILDLIGMGDLDAAIDDEDDLDFGSGYMGGFGSDDSEDETP